MVEGEQLDNQLEEAFEKYSVKPEDKSALLDFLSLLMSKHSVTRLHGEHSKRVGLKAAEIAEFQNLDKRALLYAGLTHDLGKCQVSLETLGKTSGWTDEDALAIQSHVMDGYRILMGRFDFTADTMVLHHTFQINGYPGELPPYLHPYSEETQFLIVEHGRILALADVYDALHRENDKFGEKRRLSDAEIREQMFTLNPDREKLVEDLYKVGILI